jgi:hypothetical protein
MPMPDLPHKESAECIKALEAEVRILRMLLELHAPVRPKREIREDEWV